MTDTPLTPLLDRAIQRLAAQPAVEQDTIAAMILRELDSNRAVQFEIPEVNSVHEARGEIFVEGEFLVLRFAVLNWGVTEREWETVKVERALIDGIRHERGLLKDKLLIASASDRLIRAIPGKHRDEVCLRTKKADRARVLELVDRVRAWRRGAIGAGE